MKKKSGSLKRKTSDQVNNRLIKQRKRFNKTKKATRESFHLKKYTPFLYTCLDKLDELHTTSVLWHLPSVSAVGQACSTVPSNNDGSCVDFQDQYAPWSFEEETIRNGPGILSRRSIYQRSIQNLDKHLRWSVFSKIVNG